MIEDGDLSDRDFIFQNFGDNFGFDFKGGRGEFKFFPEREGGEFIAAVGIGDFFTEEKEDERG